MVKEIHMFWKLIQSQEKAGFPSHTLKLHLFVHVGISCCDHALETIRPREPAGSAVPSEQAHPGEHHQQLEGG